MPRKRKNRRPAAKSRAAPKKKPLSPEEKQKRLENTAAATAENWANTYIEEDPYASAAFRGQAPGKICRADMEAAITFFLETPPADFQEGSGYHVFLQDGDLSAWISREKGHAAFGLFHGPEWIPLWKTALPGTETDLEKAAGTLSQAWNNIVNKQERKEKRWKRKQRKN